MTDGGDDLIEKSSIKVILKYEQSPNYLSHTYNKWLSLQYPLYDRQVHDMTL